MNQRMIALLAAKLAQGGASGCAPQWAPSTDWLSENGNPGRMYVLPDGYLYAWRQGSAGGYTNHFQPSGAQLNKAYSNASGPVALIDRTGYCVSNAIPASFSASEASPTQIRIRGAHLTSWNEAVDCLVFFSDESPTIGTDAPAIFYPIRNQEIEEAENGDLLIYAGMGSNGVYRTGMEDCHSFAISFKTSTQDEPTIAITADDLQDIIVTVDQPLSVGAAPAGWASTGVQYANYTLTDADKQAIAEQLDPPSPLTGKKVLIIGDSISADYYGNYSKWVTVLKNAGFLPADTENDSIHATGFVARYTGEDASAQNSFLDRLRAVSSPASYDLVLVFGGINDYISNVAMGSSGGDATTYFKPAVDAFFDYLVKNFTGARLAVLTPLRSYHTGKNTAGGSTATGHYQTDYAAYIRTVAEQYCLPVLDLTSSSGFCPFVEAFRQAWTLVPNGYTAPDGVHPNADCQAQLLAPQIKGFLTGLYGR